VGLKLNTKISVTRAGATSEIRTGHLKEGMVGRSDFLVHFIRSKTCPTSLTLLCTGQMQISESKGKVKVVHVFN
jgi:hypothetical protein